MTDTRRRAVRIVVFGAIWTAMMWYLVHALGRLPSRADIGAYLDAGAGPSALAFALLFALALVLRAYRFGLLIRTVADLSWRRIGTAFPWLFMAGAVTPFRMGDIVRADWVRRHGGPPAQTITLWIAERGSDMLCLVLAGVLGLALAPSSGGYQATLLVLAGTVCLGYALISVSLPLWRQFGPDRPTGTARALGEALDGFAYLSRPLAHARILGLTLVIWGVMVLGFHIALSLVLPGGSTVPMALCCAAFVNLAGLLSAAPGNIGTFQAAGVAALALFGVAEMDAFLALAALNAVGLAVTLAAGLLSRVAMALAGRTGEPPRRAR